MSKSKQSGSVEHAASWPISPALVFCGLFALAIIPIFLSPVLPMIDYYSHVARYYVLSHLDSNAFHAANYQARWGILPNIGADILGTSLMRVLPPLLSAKLIVVLIFAIQYWGLLFFSKQLTGRASLITALLGIALLYSFIFTWGFANFLLGLGLVFCGAGWWLKARTRPALAIPVACTIAVAIFLAHGVAFALYGILLGSLEIGLFLASQTRSWGNLAKSMAALAVQAVVPALLFAASPTIRSPEGVTNADEAVRRLAGSGLLWERLRLLVEHRVTTILRVSESPMAWFDVLSLVTTVAVLTLLAARGRLRVVREAWPAIALAVVLIVVVPPALFGVGYISDRMPLFAAFVLVGALAVTHIARRLDRVLVGVLAALVAARIVLIGANWLLYRADFEHYAAVAKQIEAASVVGYVNLANSDHVDPNPRCEMYGSLLAPLWGHAVPIFAYQGQQPLALAGRLAAARQSLGRLPPRDEGHARGAIELQRMATTKLFDYALVCGVDQLRAPPPDATFAGGSGRFALYRLSTQSVSRGDEAGAKPK